MAKSKKPVGRPPITVDSLPEGWQDLILGMAKEGASQVECMACFDFGKNTWYKLKNESEEFSNVCTRARALCQAWWEREGRTQLKDREFNASLWSFNMKNRFRDDWGDSQNINLNADVTTTKKKVDLDKLDEATLRKLKKASGR